MLIKIVLTVESRRAQIKGPEGRLTKELQFVSVARLYKYKEESLACFLNILLQVGTIANRNFVGYVKTQKGKF